VTSQPPADPRSATPKHGAHRAAIALFLVTFLVFVATASRDYLSLDVWSSNLASYHLVATGSPYLDGVSVHELDDNPLREVWVDDDAPNGHVVITRSPAAVIVGLPAYVLTQPSSMTVVPAAVTAALLTALSVLLMFLALVPLMRRRQALAAAAAFAFTTPVWSVAANGIWPQTISVLGIAMVAWAAAHQRWWVVGLGGLLLLWARPHAALIVAVVGLVLAWRERRIGIALRAGLPGVASVVLLSLWTHWVYGSWNPIALYGSGALAYVHESVFDLPNQLGMWIAPDRGILVFTPVLLVLLPAVLRSWRRLPAWSTALLVGGLGYTLLQNALISFNGGDPLYGYRYGLEFLACATPAFALAAPSAGRVARSLLAPVLAVQFVVIFLGSAIEGMALHYTQAWTNNAFVDEVRSAPVLLLVSGLVVVGLTLAARRLKWAEDDAHEPAPEPVADAAVR
jgi:alpha-1,2-mannosyltransferase